MTPDRWTRIQSILDDVLDRPPGQREALVAERCVDDVDLATEVRALLDGADALDDFLKEPLATVSAAAPMLSGGRVGPYRLVRALGHGGMGVVYLAERADDLYEKQVAIKLLPRAYATPEARRRFDAERRILARLDHSGIARLLDGGVTDHHQPYLVMEYVDGVPIDTYCAARDLPLDDRLDLFAAVGQAVAYAHTRLVVHRDLKPSNILVTEGGRVKLLDFGIAKLLDEADDPLVQQTRTDLRLMTPGYAAPEQVRGDDIATTTDVYALGVLLYELLTGRPPLDVRDATAAEMERIICDEPPVPPSTAVTTVDPGDEGDDRTVSPVAKRTLAGDLDVICLAALRKEPDRRYASVDAMLDDVERYRTSRPIEARTESLAYRARKYAERYRGPLAAAAVMLLLLVGGTIAYTVQVQAERNRAQQEAAKAQAVSDLLVDVFEVADPGTARGETITARALLERGSDRVLRSLDDQPAVRATMLSTMGEVYRNLGLYPRADTLYTEALAALRSLGGADPSPEVAATLYEQGLLYRQQGRHDASDSLHRAALAIWEETTEPESAEVGRGHLGLSLVLIARGRYDDARPHLRRAHTLFRRHLEPPHPDLASAVFHLGFLAHDVQNVDEAEMYFREALAMRRRLHGDGHPDVANTLNSLGVLLGRDRGDLAAADSVFRQVLAMRRQIYGDEHPAVANSLNNVASLAMEREAFAEAERLYDTLVPMVRRTLGTRHPAMVVVTSNQAITYYEQGKVDAAIDAFEASVSYAEALGPNHPQLASTQIALAEVLLDAGNPTRAETLSREAVAVQAETFGPESVLTSESKSVLAAALLDQQQHAEAESLLTNAYPVLLDARGPDHTTVEAARERLVRLYEATGRPEQAARYREPIPGPSGDAL